MKLNYAVGDTIRELRHEREMTLRKLASKSHISLGYLSEVERGQKWAGAEFLDAIASGLNLSTTELLGEVCEYLKERNG